MTGFVEAAVYDDGAKAGFGGGAGERDGDRGAGHALIGRSHADNTAGSVLVGHRDAGQNLLIEREKADAGQSMMWSAAPARRAPGTSASSGGGAIAACGAG